jgi:hypothetical protein
MKKNRTSMTSKVFILAALEKPMIEEVVVGMKAGVVNWRYETAAYGACDG